MAAGTSQHLFCSRPQLLAIGGQAKKKGTGARALRLIVEKVLQELMYETPSDQTISEILIDKDVIERKKDPIVKRHKSA